MINLAIQNNCIQFGVAGAQAEWCGKWKYTQVHVPIHPVRLRLLASTQSIYS